MTNDPRAALAAFLAERAARVRDIEERARVAIEEQGDQAGYEALMREKAELLAALADDADALPGDVDDAAADRLARFSASAAASLQVGSVFFMSALLYPEDHAPGAPNDLEAFAAELDRDAG